MAQHFHLLTYFLLKNIMNWKNGKNPIMAKELILILPSAWPWLQLKVPKLSSHFTPSSLTKLSSCWWYHFPLHSWQTVRHDSASLPHSDTLSEVTRASCGVLVSRWQIIIDVSLRSGWGRLLMYYGSDARLSEGQRDEIKFYCYKESQALEEFFLFRGNQNHTLTSITS